MRSILFNRRSFFGRQRSPWQKDSGRWKPTPSWLGSTRPRRLPKPRSDGIIALDRRASTSARARAKDACAPRLTGFWGILQLPGEGEADEAEGGSAGVQ